MLQNFLPTDVHVCFALWKVDRKYNKKVSQGCDPNSRSEINGGLLNISTGDDRAAFHGCALFHSIDLLKLIRSQWHTFNVSLCRP